MQVALAAALLRTTLLATCATASRPHPDNNPQARKLLQAAPEEVIEWDWETPASNCFTIDPDTPCPDPVGLPLVGCCGSEGVCQGINDQTKGTNCTNARTACCPNLPADSLAGGK